MVCGAVTAQKKKFSIKDFVSKCDQIRRKLRIWSHLQKKSLMENFIFCAVSGNRSSFAYYEEGGFRDDPSPIHPEPGLSQFIRNVSITWKSINRFAEQISWLVCL